MKMLDLVLFNIVDQVKVVLLLEKLLMDYLKLLNAYGLKVEQPVTIG